MYVLMDLEWFESETGTLCPTQIAALRINSQWKTASTFYERMCPPEGVSVPWDHVSFANEPHENYLYAPSAHTIFEELSHWLRPDDVLCWWKEYPPRVFDVLAKHFLGRAFPQARRILHPYFIFYAKAGFHTDGNMYLLAKERDLTLYLPEHCALHDVKVMRQLMQNLNQSVSILSAPPKFKASAASSLNRLGSQFPYWYDPDANTVHMLAECATAHNPHRVGVKKISVCLLNQYKPCPICCGENWRKAVYAYNRDNMDRRNCSYFFLKGAAVFHRGNCSKILYAGRPFEAAGHYNTCLRKGYRPCKICKPIPDLSPAASCAFPYPKKPLCSQYAHRAVPKSLEFSFLAGLGLQTFHLPHCQRLKGVRHIQGFFSYQDAIGAGLLPCRECKPSPLNDNVVPSLYPSDLSPAPASTALSSKETESPVSFPGSGSASSVPTNRTLSKTEKRAIRRYLEATAERATISTESLSSLRQADAKALTSSEYVFWAAKGYANFHLRSCKRLAKLSCLRGFSTFEQAIRAGYQPCRECRPATKYDLPIVMSSTTTKKNESPESILALCCKMGLEHTYEDPLLHLHTPKADWKIDIRMCPLVIKHKPNGASAFHTQHKMFLSVTDALKYICKHDSVKKPAENASEEV